MIKGVGVETREEKGQTHEEKEHGRDGNRRRRGGRRREGRAERKGEGQGNGRGNLAPLPFLKSAPISCTNWFENV